MELSGFGNFDELLAFHCSPVLSGLKPANLVALPSCAPEEADALLMDYNRQFKRRGLVFRKLCSCSERSLLLVYHEQKLKRILRDKGYRAYLVAAGYAQKASVKDDLLRLEQRLQAGKGFPHEMGVFLGYPLEDILGFVLHRGDGCKYRGYWKVYGDVDRAKKMFAAYESCRRLLLQKLAEGMSLYGAVAAI